MRRRVRWLRAVARRAWGGFARRALCDLAEAGDAEALEAVLEVARSRRGRGDRDPLLGWVAARWVRHRDERLRAVVLETGAVAPGYGDAVITLGLHGRLAEGPVGAIGDRVVACLDDPDETVRANAGRVCETATGTALDILWRYAAAGRRPELVDPLIANPAPLSEAALAWAWVTWLGGDDPPVTLTERLSVPANPAPEHYSSISPAGTLLWSAHRQSMIVLGLAKPARLLAAVLAPGTPEHVRERAAVGCVRRDLIPADPVERALVLLSAGQGERYRESDPDGSLLAARYPVLSPARRALLRRAMLRTGEIALLTAVTGGPKRWTVAERAAAVDRLATLGEWEEIWRMFPRLPFEEGLEAVRRIRDWRPPPPDDELFDLLTEPPPTWNPLVIPDPGLRETLGTFSAGGTRLILLDGFKDLRDGVVVRMYAMPDGTPLPSPDWPPVKGGGHLLGAAPNGPGFVAVAQGNRLLFGNQILREIDVSGLATAYAFHSVAAERRTGRLALLGDRDVVLASRTGRALATIPLDVEMWWSGACPFHVAFPGDGRLIVVAHRPGGELMLQEWAFDARRTPVRVTRRDRTAFRPRGMVSPGPRASLARYDGGDRMAVADRGTVRFFDTATLTEIDEPRVPSSPKAHVWSVWSSPGGEYLAIHTSAGVEVHGPFSRGAERMLARPLAELGPAELRTVARLRGRFPDRHPKGWRLRLLQECLERRIRAAGVTAREGDA
ncbi:hypothetical protein AB0K60_16620 [Thermopolyspora sp. NPDC052614]|uniref:hypothetical protein n=1 Tax=Thermopolyspora sp. NPDC052614 TaxID=3155682 RepID=UPI003421FB6B